MHRFVIFLLSVVVVAIPTISWGATTSTSSNLAINVAPGQAIAAVSLSNNNFTAGAPSGTAVGAISVTMSPASPTFSGSLSLSGTNAPQFQISGGELVTNGVVGPGTYQINIVATESSVTGSPFSQAATITATASPSGSNLPGPNSTVFANPYYTCTKNYYVATNGNDNNPGTLAQPWATLGNVNHASSYLTPGTCINVESGDYNNQGAQFGLGLFRQGSSTPTGYLVIRSYNTLNGARFHYGAPGDNSFFNIATDYVIIDGLEIDCGEPVTNPTNGNAAGVEMDGHEHIKILNSIIHDCGSSGIENSDSGDFYEIAYNHLYRNSTVNGASTSAINIYIPHQDDAAANNDDSKQLFRIWVHHNISEHNYCNFNCFDGNGAILDNLSTGGNDGTQFDYRLPVGITYNWFYQNGGRGVSLTASGYEVVDHNSFFNNSRSQLESGATDCPDLSYQGAQVGDTNHAPTVTNNAFYNQPVNCGGRQSSCFWRDTNGPWDTSQFANNATFNGTTGQNCIDSNTPAGSINPATNTLGVNPGFVNITSSPLNLCISPSSAIYGKGIGSC
jgi:hypothetical protein